MLQSLKWSIFTIELIGKLIVYRLSFFRNGWNNFDFIIAPEHDSLKGQNVITRAIHLPLDK